KIIFAFRELAEERGFYGAAVDELARRNNMSKRTIYRYFNSKEELIEAVMRRYMEETEKMVDYCLSTNDNPIIKMTNLVKLLSERLRKLNPRIMNDLQKHYPQIWEKLEQFRANKIRNINTVLLEGVKEGYFKEINPVIVTNSLLAAVRAVVNPTFVLENNLTMNEALEDVFKTFLYGIVADDKKKQL
ncbi:MAG: TetR/AcrR family transcriptional regulator, partial [Desulfotomaculum sp.]|nr:TetR/AcrR family transcriptional regulator [Desulfotomaculum sp.]